jgi:hypothetical protein
MVRLAPARGLPAEGRQWIKTARHVGPRQGTGDAEGNLDQSSRVPAVVDFSGPADLLRKDPNGTKPKDNEISGEAWMMIELDHPNGDRRSGERAVG